MREPEGTAPMCSCPPPAISTLLTAYGPLLTRRSCAYTSWAAAGPGLFAEKPPLSTGPTHDAAICLAFLVPGAPSALISTREPTQLLPRPMRAHPRVTRLPLHVRLRALTSDSDL